MSDESTSLVLWKCPRCGLWIWIRANETASAKGCPVCGWPGLDKRCRLPTYEGLERQRDLARGEIARLRQIITEAALAASGPNRGAKWRVRRERSDDS